MGTNKTHLVTVLCYSLDVVLSKVNYKVWDYCGVNDVAINNSLIQSFESIHFELIHTNEWMNQQLCFNTFILVCYTISLLVFILNQFQQQKFNFSSKTTALD